MTMEKAHFSKSFQRSHIGIFLESMRAILEVCTFSHFGTTSIYGPKNLRGHVGPYPGTPKFLIQFYKLVTTEHVAKFGGDRPRYL